MAHSYVTWLIHTWHDPLRNDMMSHMNAPCHIRIMYVISLIHTHIYIYTHIHIHTYTYTRTYIYTHIHIHTYTYTHIYIYTHINTHTYTYTHIYVVRDIAHSYMTWLTQKWHASSLFKKKHKMKGVVSRSKGTCATPTKTPYTEWGSLSLLFEASTHTHTHTHTLFWASDARARVKLKKKKTKKKIQETVPSLHR